LCVGSYNSKGVIFLMFDHFIITQFNVVFNWTRNGLSSPTKAPDKNWMLERWKLFERYCYPSIINQTNQNFKWFVFFDGKTTDKNRVNKYSRIIPVYIKHNNWTYDDIIKTIKPHIENDYVITTRLDNDDALSIQYVDEVQKRFTPTNFQIFNFINGQIFDTKQNRLYNYDYQCTNPFISVVELNANLKTCFYLNHPEMGKQLGHVVKLRTAQPGWLQVQHGGNLGNHEVRGKHTDVMKLDEYFAVDIFNKRCDLAYKHHLNMKSDINEHLPVLYEYGKRCEHITEMGVRFGVSTLSWLLSKPKDLVCYDISDVKFKTKLPIYNSYAKSLGVNFTFIVKDVLKVNISDTDLLFIDTWHTYEQLTKELKLHSSKVRKYIVLHDTETFKDVGEDLKSPGLRKAISEFLYNNKEWKLKLQFLNNNGLTILERT
jgi:hypothetical protein